MHCQGILLSLIDYEEFDRIATILTSEDEIIAFLIKGGQKPSNKNFGAVQYFGISEYSIFLRGLTNLGKLQRACKLIMGTELYKNYHKMQLAHYYLHLLTKGLQYSSENHEGSFNLLQKIFATINDAEDGYAKLVLNLHHYILVQNKIHFCLDSCVRCGSKINIGTISYWAGGYICKNCFIPGQDNKMPLFFLKIFKSFGKTPENIISYAFETKFHILKFIENFYCDIYGIALEHYNLKLLLRK